MRQVVTPGRSRTEAGCSFPASDNLIPWMLRGKSVHIFVFEKRDLGFFKAKSKICTLFRIDAGQAQRAPGCCKPPGRRRLASAWPPRRRRLAAAARIATSDALALAPRERNHRLDVVGMGKHVHRLHDPDPVAGSLEITQIAHLRRGIARDVDDPLR